MRWFLEDPKDKPIEEVRRIREAIKGKVLELLESEGLILPADR